MSRTEVGGRLTADRDVCIGAGSCVSSAPHLFDHDPVELTVVVLQEELSGQDIEYARQAVSACPSMALQLREFESSEAEA